MASLFANPLAQKAFSYLLKKAGFGAREAIGLVSQKMNDNQALLKLMKEYGYKPKKVPTTKTTSVDKPKKVPTTKTTSVDKPLGPGGKE